MSQSGGDSTLAAVIESSRAGAESVEQGRFRLDWERALDKIKRFQLTDAHRYVLELVQAAVANQATRIDVTTDSDDVILRFDGAAYTEVELSRLFDYLFAQQLEHVRLKELALGINAALALEPKFIVVDSGDGEHGYRMRLTSYRDLRVDRLTDDQMIRGTRIHVRDRTSWHVVTDLVRGNCAEAQLIAENCPFSPILIVLDGTDVRQPLVTPALARHSFDARGIRGELLLPAEPRPDSQIELCMGGVRIVSFSYSTQRWLGAVGVVGWVDNPLLSRNASHSDVHHDEAFQHTMGAVRSAVRALMEKWLRHKLLDGESGLAGSAPTSPDSAQHLDRHAAPQLSEVDRHYLQLAARVFLPRGKRASADVQLSEELEALLDVPGLIDLAIERRQSSLRPFYGRARAGGRIALADRTYDLALGDLPDDLLPALGPRWLLEQLFGGKLERVDDTLAEIAAGVRTRRLREANPREPELSLDDVILKVPIADPSTGLRGEVGLGRDGQGTLVTMTWFALRIGVPVVDLEAGKHGFLVVFLRDGIFLDCHRVQGNLLCGVAVVDSKQFTATDAWDNLVRDQAYDHAGKLLAGAIPTLLRALAETVAELPPPRSLRDVGHWTPRDGITGVASPGSKPSWLSDPVALRARDHADAILRRHRKLTREDAPWLYEWPLFFLLDGTPITITELEASTKQVGYVVDQPWGDGGPNDMVVVNLSSSQKKILGRYVANTRSVDISVAKWRHLQCQLATKQARRDQNYAAALSRRQPPRLDGMWYAAVVDLELADVKGQVGIPGALSGPSSIRYLIDGVPLPDVEFDCPIPVHAVAQGGEIEADALFEKLVSRKPGLAVERAITRALPGLVAGLVASATADSKAGRDLVWSFLASLKTGAKSRLGQLPDPIADFALVRSVAHGLLSLRRIQDDAAHSGGSFLCTELSAFRQLSERPIVVAGEQRTKVIARLLGVRAQDYTRQLETELEALARLDQPRRRAVLIESMALIGDVVGERISGQIGIPADLATLVPGYDHRWIELLREGFLLERVPLEVDGLPFAAVVECPALTPTPQWDGTARDAAFEAVLAAVRAAAGELVATACAELPGLPGRSATAVAFALRELCARWFRGRPEPQVDGSPGETSLANAAIWDSATGLRDRISLVDISDHWKRSGAVWVVENEIGHVAQDHVIIRLAPGDSAAPLQAIFGAAVVDGAKTLRRDEAAYQRRQAAPDLDLTLDPSAALGPVAIDHQDAELDLSITGQVALYRDYRSADPGTLRLRIGVDGKLLGDHEVAAPLRGFGHLDCHGLHTNRAWTKLADQRQRNLIDQVAIAALWSSLDQIDDELVELTPGVVAHEHLRTIFLEALAALAERLQLAAERVDEQPALRDRLMAAPLFRTVQGRAISANELAAEVASSGRLLAVGREVDDGNPGDGRLIVRAGEVGLEALTAMWGKAVVRHDLEWQTELAGQRRRRATPRVSPQLDGEVVAQAYFQDGATSGVAGLLRPGIGDSEDDSDPPSRLRLHIDYRKVVDRMVDWHPAVEIWLNDDSLQPNPAFDDVVDDDAHAHAVAVADAQIVELVARAAERCQDEGAGGLRLRLCNYVMTRLPELLAGRDRIPGGAEARLLAAPLWNALTVEGPRTVSTLALQLAHERDALAVVGEEHQGRPAADRLVARVGDTERAWLTARWGELFDYTKTLLCDEAARRFESRPEVTSIDLGEVAGHAVYLLRCPLSTAACEGELGIGARPGRSLSIELFWNRRRLASRELAAPVGATVAVQCTTLTPTEAYADVVTDHACMQFLDAMRGELYAALGALATGFAELPPERRDPARLVLCSALTNDRAKQGGDPLPGELRTAIEHAPLLVDVGGRAWSLAAVREAAGKAEIAAVSSETVRMGAALEDRLVLVIDSPEAWRELVELLPVTRYDSRYAEAIEGYRRMERAPDRFELSQRRTLVPAPVTGPPFEGEVGLGVPPGPGWLALFAHGRMVEKRGFPAHLGLVGYLGGEIACDHGFQAAQVSRDQMRAIAKLYRERLAAAVDLAGAYTKSRRSRSWAALCDYVVLYLTDRLGNAGSNMTQRRDKVLDGDPDLEPRLRAAISIPVFQQNDGSWIDLATAISGDEPTVVLCEERVRKPHRAATMILVGDVSRLSALLALVLPRRSVVDHQEFVAAQRERAAKQVAELAQREEAATRRLLAAVKSTLRAVLDKRPRGRLKISMVNKLELAPRGRGDLVEVGQDDQMTLNESHAVWKSAVKLKASGDVAASHLAMAVLADLVRGEAGLVSTSELIAMAQVIGAKARARSS